MTTTTRDKPSGVRSSSGVLDQIVEAKARRLDEAKLRAPVGSFIRHQRRGSHPFLAAVSRTTTINIIAEIKRRSPSKGVIREDFDAVSIAESYAAGGAAALSVLCEEDFFGGSLEHLKAIRNRVELPLLRKDFIFDEYQIYESASAGADAILLIVAVLEDELLKRLIELSNELGLDALVEVHTPEEMSRAARAGAKLIGVNNRDLTTFKVDLDTSLRLAALAPEETRLISESGIANNADIRRLRASGFAAFLIGEHLMRAAHPGDELRCLIELT